MPTKPPYAIYAICCTQKANQKCRIVDGWKELGKNGSRNRPVGRQNNCAKIHSAPIMLLGKNANSVPIIARIENTVTKRYSKNFWALPILSPKSFKWKSRGNTIQIVKHNAEPMNAIILSNAGNTMARATNTIMTATRVVTFSRPLVWLERPLREGLLGTARESRPVKTSIVLMMGRTLRGNLVSGMIAMNTLTRIVRDLG